MRSIKVTLCEHCSECPEVEITDEGVSIGEDENTAIRLLKALVAAGANTRAPMDSAWVDKIAVRDMDLRGTALASAIAYAEGEGWPKKRLGFSHSCW